jgi:hypothetical protein
MEVKKELLASCGLYCGVCGVLIAHRDNNQKFKERLSAVYGCSPEEIACMGCHSDERFKYCQTCAIRSCTLKKHYGGCHQCDDFPCPLIDAMKFAVGRKVALRAIPAWRRLGTERWVEEEEKRYHCPSCGYTLFRGAKSCRNCREPVDRD